MAAALATGYLRDTPRATGILKELQSQDQDLLDPDDELMIQWMVSFYEASTVTPLAPEEEASSITPVFWLWIALRNPPSWRAVTMAVPCIGRFALKTGIMARVASFFIQKANLPRLMQAFGNGRHTVFFHRLCSRRHGLVVEGKVWGNMIRTTVTLMDRGARAQYLAPGLPNQIVLYVNHNDTTNVQLRFHRARRSSINFIELAIGGTTRAICGTCGESAFFVSRICSASGRFDYEGGQLCADCRYAATFTPARMLTRLDWRDMELSPILFIPTTPERARSYMQELADQKTFMPRAPPS